jgi:hypothetical protein
LKSNLLVCVNYLENQIYSKEIYEKAYIKLSNSGVEVPEHYDEIFAAVFLLLTNFLRLPKGIVKADELKGVLEDLKFQEDCIDDLLKVTIQHRDSLSQNLYEMKALQTRIKKFEYRINLSLISEITKLNQPTIILCFDLGNQIKTIELSIANFHRLRLLIAQLLKEMHVLESRQIMKH